MSSYWQKIDPPLWKSEADIAKTKLYVLFVQMQLCEMSLCQDLNEAQQNLSFLCSKVEPSTAMHWLLEELSTIWLGPV